MEKLIKNIDFNLYTVDEIRSIFQKLCKENCKVINFNYHCFICVLTNKINEIYRQREMEDDFFYPVIEGILQREVRINE